MADIKISGAMLPGVTDTPLDARSRVATVADIANIEQPALGALVYCIADGKLYKITKLKGKVIGPLTVQNAAVDTYEEFGGGVTADQAAAWNAKQDAITGTAGQVVGFGADGTPVAQDAAGMTDVERARLLPASPCIGDVAVFKGVVSGNGRNNDKAKLLLPLTTDFADTAAGTIGAAVTTAGAVAIESDTGKFGGGAAKFTGAKTDQIKLAYPTSLLTASSCRISFWVKAQTTSTEGRYIFSSLPAIGDYDNYLVASLDPGGVFIRVSKDTHVTVPFYSGLWNFVEFIYQSGKWYACVNGTPVANTTAALTTSQAICFGNIKYNGSNQNVFDGLLSEVMIEQGGDYAALATSSHAVPAEPATPFVTTGQWVAAQPPVRSITDSRTGTQHTALGYVDVNNIGMTQKTTKAVINPLYDATLDTGNTGTDSNGNRQYVAEQRFATSYRGQLTAMTQTVTLSGAQAVTLDADQYSRVMLAGAGTATMSLANWQDGDRCELVLDTSTVTPVIPSAWDMSADIITTPALYVLEIAQVNGKVFCGVKYPMSANTSSGGTGGAIVVVSTTAPASPSDGTIWINPGEA